MKNSSSLIFSIFVTITLKGCSTDDGRSGYVIPSGSYQFSRPTCMSTNEPPAYTELRRAAALYDFDALARREIAIDGRKATEHYQDDDCSLTVTRSVHRNGDDAFSMKLDRTHHFEPQDCDLAVMVSGESISLGKESALFRTESSQKEDIPFSLAKEGEVFVLTSSADHELETVWQEVGCAADDALQYRLEPKSPP